MTAVKELRWAIKEQPDQEAVEKLAHELHVSKTIASLLMQRGIETFDQAKAFFRPEFTHLHDPFLMKDMDVAVERIEKAMNEGEKVLIWGDYDVDGTTSVSLVYSFLKGLHKNTGYYLPDRYKEGYGISRQGIDWAKENGYTLIVSLDCGIKAVDTIAYAKEQDIEFIVCDHHRPGKELPPAVAVLDSKREDCTYPYDELPGCGIGFKLVQAIAQKHEIEFEALEQYLDLVAIAIACDIVPITGENRVLAAFGLQQLNSAQRPGIKSLVELSKFKRKQLTIGDLVFVIGPRINAAGRMEHGSSAVELLIAPDDDAANIAGQIVNTFNTQRREIDQQTTAHALEMIEESEELIRAKSTVLYHQDWHKGVVGITASRVIESYHRPTIILTKNNPEDNGTDALAAGSARSVRGFDVYNAITECSDLLEQFGGHTYAAGLTLKVENIPAFREKFEQVVSATITEEMLVPEIRIDAEIALEEITPKFFRILQQFAPFGPKNMRPVFLTSGVMNAGWSKAVGQDEAHLKLDVCQPENEDFKMSGIAFNMGHLWPDIEPEGTLFDIVYTVEENEWKDRTHLQLKVRDIRV